jgi:hypothetical protein
VATLAAARQAQRAAPRLPLRRFGARAARPHARHHTATSSNAYLASFWRNRASFLCGAASSKHSPRVKALAASSIERNIKAAKKYQQASKREMKRKLTSKSE